MDVVILPDAERVADLAAHTVCDFLREKPHAVLGLATGNTPVQLYRRLVDCYRDGEVTFADVSTFNLDEYVGLGAGDPQSYRAYMQRELFDAIDIDRANTFLPVCRNAGDSSSVSQEYEKRLRAKGGIDLQILGIGQNGHIGFNEPTSSLGSRTRLKTLTQDTLAANRRYFDSPVAQPELAITMGIATILEADAVLLLATGASKADAVRQAIEGPLAAGCPASALQTHRKVTVLLDEAAAGELERRSYYDWVQQQKRKLGTNPVGGVANQCRT